ncbi:MAG: flavin reductase family protein [Nocardioidaceae bacterium]|nr:flavin reductase family protein [Nocardioidaceae bacterium]
MRTELASDDPDVDSYRLLTAVVVPRPIAWVSTISAEGLVNLAPHSFYTVACAQPPIVSITSVGAKDTLRNVGETGEFVVSLAAASMITEVNDSSARFPPYQSEAAQLGIAMEPSSQVGPPRVAASPVAIECILHSTVELGDSTLILGTVKLLSIRDDVLVDGHPDYLLLDPLARLGKDEWALHAEVRSLRRPHRPEDIGR